MLFVSLTLAILSNAEFGFLGVVVFTWVQTPRLCGQLCRAGEELFCTFLFLPCLTSWFIVGNRDSPYTRKIHPALAPGREYTKNGANAPKPECTITYLRCQLPLPLSHFRPSREEGPWPRLKSRARAAPCLLYTSDAADDLLCVDL